jgi:1-phosphatidylinositol phosphodiesterase
MQMHRSSLRSSRVAIVTLLFFGAGAVAAACNGTPAVGTGNAGDAGADTSPPDTGAPDSAAAQDAPSSQDASSPEDAMSPDDSSSATDADAASGDSSVSSPQDAGLDALTPQDAGADAAFVVETEAGTFTASNWMGAFPGSTSVADLSIPGTHDTGATIDMPGTTGTTKCQNLGIADQLAAGVRYFDIRVHNLSNQFEVYHLTVDQELTFASLLQSISTFFAANPSETLIMSVKEETPDPQTGSTNTFEQTFDSYTAANPAAWYLGDTIPTLDQARGKIVLLRRFSATNLPTGIDVTAWNSEALTTFTIANGDATLQIQDDYQVTDDPSKWTAITDLFAFALQSDAGSDVFFLNNTSAYVELDSGLEDILFVSNVINPELTTYFAAATAARYGIVGMDFVDTAKASLILSTNFP